MRRPFDLNSKRFLASCQSAARITGLVVILLAGTLLIEDLARVSLVGRLLSVMAPPTALTLLLLGVAIAAGTRRPRLTLCLGWAALVISVGTFCKESTAGPDVSYAAYAQAHWRKVPAGKPAWQKPAHARPAQSPPKGHNTLLWSAVGTALLGSALVLGALPGAAFASQLPALAASACGLLILIAELYGKLSFERGHPGSNTHGFLLISALGVAVICRNIEKGPLWILATETDAGRLARWMLPGSLMIPVIFGGLKYIGFEARWFDNEHGLALFAVLNMLTFLVLVLWAGKRLLAMETERDRFFTLSLDMLCVARTDGYFHRLNPAFERILGFSRAELLQRPIVEFVHPEDREATGKVLEELSEGIDTVGFENRYVCKDGSLRWMLWTAAAAPDGMIFAAARDITARKQAEEELRAVAAKLENSNAELEQFAYIASHDLQEPLRGVAGCAQILHQRYSGQLDARADELIGHVVSGATRMKSLIDDLLTFSRVGRRVPEYAAVDLLVCVKTALLNLQTAIEESGAHITLCELPTLSADARLLPYLFQNLIGNAIKFCVGRTPEISLRAEACGDHWRFAIHDNGIGIEARFFERIFGIFQRLHTRREFPGTGIGLALCRKIVERHNGRIWVESQLERGSVFYFTLPAIP